jgi:hypothetical protein
MYPTQVRSLHGALDQLADYLFQGLLCDLLWSDPDKDITGWSENDRGVSFTFGPDVVSRFLQKHDMDLICRAHQVRLESWLLQIRSQLEHPAGCGGRVRILRQATSGDAILGTKLLRRV